jgi:hypothetical protein
MGKQEAIDMAQQIVEKYGKNKTVEQLLESAHADKMFKSDKDAMAVWGRLRRLVRA